MDSPGRCAPRRPNVRGGALREPDRIHRLVMVQRDVHGRPAEPSLDDGVCRVPLGQQKLMNSVQD